MKLYVVPTPVGNLEDITLRALRVLREVDVVLAEDTRTTGILLAHYDIHTPLESHHKWNEHETSQRVAERIENGRSVALVSDAGTPGISDPGFMLVRECVRRGVEVECLPGATAFVPALVQSGLPTDHFVFEGFLPPKKGRATRLAQLSDEARTIVIYESPRRTARTLAELSAALGAEREAALVREVSKLHAETRRGTLGTLADGAVADEPRGEIVIVVGPKPEEGRREHVNKYKTTT